MVSAYVKCAKVANWFGSVPFRTKSATKNHAPQRATAAIVARTIQQPDIIAAKNLQRSVAKLTGLGRKRGSTRSTQRV